MHTVSFRLTTAGGWRRIIRPVLIITLAAMLLAPSGLGRFAARAASDPNCQTAFFVFTDPNNQGTISQRGPIVRAKGSGILGSYTSGRFAGYNISGLQDITVNQVTGQATITGSFVAASQGDASSFTFRYAGKADLNTGEATGSFVAYNGTGTLDGFHASGKIQAELVGPAAFAGVDLGLC
ncbi:MAG: hypothetical protein KatS3mg059_1499 [Thermomicrobiales bacterium]|nr:MAG: hypothetical protein KatS3mg059_1499 [Thermomicrobiales bacterium]